VRRQLVSMLMLGLGFITVSQTECYAANAPQPGLWEVTSKKERAGAITEEPNRTQCISAEQSREFGSRSSITASGSRKGLTCSISDWQKFPDGMSWRLRCIGAISAEQEGRYVFTTPRHYTAEFISTVTIPGRRMSSKVMIEATWIGECPK
jgi:hypothetical protein